MYARHFGMRTEAFALTPDPAFLYMSPEHAEALAALEVGLRSRRGLMVLTGEVGTGKTTLLYSLLTRLGSDVRTAYIANTKLSFDHMLQQALTDFGVSSASRDRLEQLNVLNTFLRRCATEQATAALVIDEAQNLDADAFENLRLLSNFETFTSKLLQIVLVGQPELEEKLRSPSLRQVAERVGVHCHVNPLSRAESRKYIEHRLHCVGGSSDVFTPAALRLVIKRSRGIPRRMNIICHNALLFAYGEDAPRVGWSHVRAAVRERAGRGLVTMHRAAALTSNIALAPWVAAATVLLATLAAVAVNLDHGRRTGVAPDRNAADPEPAAAQSAALQVRDPRDPEEPMPVGEAAAEPAPVADAGPPALGPGVSGIGVEATRQSGSTGKSTAPVDGPSFRFVRVAPGATLASLAKEIYGVATPQVISRLQLANPQLVDADHIRAGDRLRFPELKGAGQAVEVVGHRTGSQ